MQITVQLRADVARTLAERSPPTADTNEIREVLSPFGLTLQPLHPGTHDPELRSQFWLDVPEQATAEQVLHQLLQLKAIKAAYLKPRDEMP